LQKPQELIVLGFKEVLAHPGHIVLIEWPELVKKYLPKDAAWISIEHPEHGNTRSVTVQ